MDMDKQKFPWLENDAHSLWVKETQPVQKKYLSVTLSSWNFLPSFCVTAGCMEQGLFQVPTGFTLAHRPCKAFSSFFHLAGTFSIMF